MDGLTDFLYQYGLSAIFFMILLEYACFPISSEIVLPLSGAIASLQGISFAILLPASVLAGLIGTTFCFLVGRIGGNRMLTGIEKRFPKTKKGLDTSRSKFRQYGCYSVCFCRVIPICRTYIAFFAGAADQNYAAFFFSSLIGITTWNSILLGLGYLFRENWSQVSLFYDKNKYLLLCISLTVILLLSLRLLKKTKKE